MPKCLVCDGDSFDLQDGLYYCSSCQTQTQDLLEEETEADDQLSGYSSSSSVRISIGAKASRSGSSNIDFGKKWTTHDAFNIILKKQVDALIKLGASSKLKPVVLNLWVSYMKKCGVSDIIIRKRKCGNKRLRVAPRERDIQVLLGTDSKLYPLGSTYRKRKRVMELKRKKGSKPKKLSRKSFATKDDEEGTTTEKSEYFSNDSISDASSKSFCSSNPKPCSLNKMLSKSTLRVKKLSRSGVSFCMERMKMSRTLSFIYLGLLLVGDQILLSDVIRWLWEDHVPLFYIVDIISEEMKFQTWDTQTFRLLHSVTYEGIRSDTERLAKFLSIAELPCRPLQYIAARFIKELSLPGSMYAVVFRLMCIHPPRTSWNPRRRSEFLPNWEALAMAYIIIALKLTFGLDNVTEWQPSQDSSHCNAPFCCGKRALRFTFAEWRKQICVRQELQSSFWLRALRQRVCRKSVDFDALAWFYNKKAHKVKGKPCCYRSQWARTSMQEIWDVLSRPFCVLLRKATTMCSKMNTVVTHPTSFPLQSEAKAAQKTTGVAVQELHYAVHDLLDGNGVIFNAMTNGEIQLMCSDEEQMPSSVAWLLGLCAELIEMKTESVYEEVGRVEKALFIKGVGEKDCITHQTNSSCSSRA